MPIRRLILIVIALSWSFSLAPFCMADDDDKPTPAVTDATAHYGLFGWLDHRSKYGQDWFPELFRVDETDVSNELRFDWQHLEGKNVLNNQVGVQVEKAFGLLTLEIQAPYVITGTGPAGLADDGGPAGGGTGISRAKGMGTVQINARHPLYQSVSKSGFFDNTVGFSLEVGIPSNSPVSKNTEISPRIFDDLRLGNHFSLQALFGPDWLLGPRPLGGHHSTQYGVGFAYAIEDEQLPLPHVERTIPIFELLGEIPMNGLRTTGHNTFTGSAGVRFEFKSIAHLHPQFGVAYLFPISSSGRDELHWGILTSLVFEF